MTLRAQAVAPVEATMTGPALRDDARAVQARTAHWQWPVLAAGIVAMLLAYVGQGWIGIVMFGAALSFTGALMLLDGPRSVPLIVAGVAVAFAGIFVSSAPAPASSRPAPAVTVTATAPAPAAVTVTASPSTRPSPAVTVTVTARPVPAPTVTVTASAPARPRPAPTVTVTVGAPAAGKGSSAPLAP